MYVLGDLPVWSVISRRRRLTKVARWAEDGDAPLGRCADNVPLSVDPEVVRRDDTRRVCDVHSRAVVRVGADEHRTALRVEREVGDVDVTGRAEDAARLPVQQAVRV